METGAQREQGGDPAPRGDPALSRPEDPGGELEERRLARAIRAEQPERLALRHVEQDALERPEPLLVDAEPDQPLLERRRPFPIPAELFADALDGDRRG